MALAATAVFGAAKRPRPERWGGRRVKGDSGPVRGADLPILAGHVPLPVCCVARMPFLDS